MRRFVLTLILISASGWAQAAQQQAQPPIVVQVQTPPENIWATALKLAIPTAFALFGALFGVWLTNKNNERTNAATRAHQLDLERKRDEIASQAKSRDNRWEFRKDVYVNLLNSITDCISILAQLHELQVLIPAKLESPDADLQRTLEDHRTNFISASAVLTRYANLAPLAMADSVVRVIMTLDKQLPAFFLSDPGRATSLMNIIANFNTARDTLQDAGRRELWGTPENEAEVEAAVG